MKAAMEKSNNHISVTAGQSTMQFPHPNSIKCWTDNMKLWPKVEGPQIICYLLESKAIDMKAAQAFRSLESYNYLQSGWVGQVLMHELTEDLCYLKADVTPSQKLSENPHAAWVCVKSDGDVVTGGCSCMAGKARVCSHVGAVLWKVDMANRLGLTGLSSTDTQSKWNRGTKRNLEPVEVKEMSFRTPSSKVCVIEGEGMCRPTINKNKPQQYFSHSEFVQDFRSTKLAALAEHNDTLLYRVLIPVNSVNTCSSVVPMEVQPLRQLSHSHSSIGHCDPCMAFYKQYVSVSDTARKQILLESLEQSNSDVWHSARLIRINASSASKIPKRESTDPKKFLLAKLYKPFKGNKNTRHGSLYEDFARNEFESVTSLRAERCGLFISKKHPWLSASPDAILEIKCPVCDTLEEAFKRLDVIEENGKLTLKPCGQRRYYTQVQLAMYCSERVRCFFYICLPSRGGGSTCAFFDIDYDGLFVANCLKFLDNFFSKQCCQN